MIHHQELPRPRPGELLISEVFGPTLQGEGPASGRAAAFLRLGRCNLACSWCDSAYTWDSNRYDLKAELQSVAREEVISDILARAAPLVVVTGGEPLLQRTELVPLVTELRAAGREVHFETSGSISPGKLADHVDAFVVSPKLANTEQPTRVRLRWSVLEEFARLPTATFKFVVTSRDDLDEVEEVASRLQLAPTRVWVMPEGITLNSITSLMQTLAGEVGERGWSLSSRLHILLWGDERGH